MLGIRFRVVPSNHKEIINKKLTPVQLAKYFALNKAQAVAKKFPNDLVLGVDTLVVSAKGKLIGKARNKIVARNTLKLLSGSRHLIISGIALVKGVNKIVASEKSWVTFAKLTDKDIEWWLDQNEWQGRSGAFTVEEKGARFVKKVEGDFWNVVGLPVFRLSEMLKKFGDFH